MDNIKTISIQAQVDSKVTETNGVGSRGYKENDKFHTGLLFGVLIMAYGLNHAFGFNVGTIPYGTLFALAIAVMDCYCCCRLF